MDTIEQLVARGYTPEEALLVQRVVQTAEHDRARALRSGRCPCGGRLQLTPTTLDCPACDGSFAAAA